MWLRRKKRGKNVIKLLVSHNIIQKEQTFIEHLEYIHAYIYEHVNIFIYICMIPIWYSCCKSFIYTYIYIKYMYVWINVYIYSDVLVYMRDYFQDAPNTKIWKYSSLVWNDIVFEYVHLPMYLFWDRGLLQAVLEVIM
jgi:hypothetical protein